MMRRHLLFTRRFGPLFVTQFLGAFNDNVFKNALVVLIAYRLAGPGEAQMLVTLAAGLFILPYLLFSATAGQCADKYDRARIARIVKIAEIILMVIAAIGFAIGNAYFLLFVLFCMGVHSTFFGPVKFALLPQHLREGELIAGNAYIEAGTFLAILLGTILGGAGILHPQGLAIISGIVIGSAVLGYISSRFIPAAPGGQPGLKLNPNIAAQTWRVISHDKKNKTVFGAILAISWFWLVGATFLSQFPTYAKDVLLADETVVTLFLTVFSVGIALGSLLCNRLLRGAITMRLVPWGAWGIAVFGVDLYFASGSIGLVAYEGLMGVSTFLAQSGSVRILIDLLGIAISGGVFIVPLYAVMQHASDVGHRARTIATNNIMNALFMVGASLATMGALVGGLSVAQVFLLVSLATALVALRYSTTRHA